MEREVVKVWVARCHIYAAEGKPADVWSWTAPSFQYALNWRKMNEYYCNWSEQFECVKYSYREVYGPVREG